MTNAEANAKIKSLLMAEIDRIPSHYDTEIAEQVYSDTAKFNELLELNKIVCEALERQTHGCKNCLYADYMAETNRIYCLAHGCVMTLDNYCRDWSDIDWSDDDD